MALTPAEKKRKAEILGLLAAQPSQPTTQPIAEPEPAPVATETQEPSLTESLLPRTLRELDPKPGDPPKGFGPVGTLPGGVGALALDLGSAVGKTLVASIDKVINLVTGQGPGFLESLKKTEAGDESGAVSEFIENAVRAPDTFVGLLSGGATAKIATKLSTMALKSPAAAKVFSVFFDAFQQGAITATTTELEEIAKGNDVDVLRATKNLLKASGFDVGARGALGAVKKIGSALLQGTKSLPTAAAIPETSLQPDPQGFQQTPAAITKDPLRESLELGAQTAPFLYTK